jgi:hypothetical protein
MIFIAYEIAQNTRRSMTMEFTVQANQTWQATGVQVPQDAQVTIRYLSGYWVFNSDEPSCDADGNSRLIAKVGYPLPGEPEGALIGRLGGQSFPIGDETTELNSAEGQAELYLVINDDIDQIYGRGLDDNSGSIQVDIQVSW